MTTEQPTQRVTAGVILIGNEILSGRTQDINLNHLALTLGGWGIQVVEARVIADVETTIVASVNEFRSKFNYVFTTGGIGPTHDDITAPCIAKAFGVPLIMHPEIEALIRQHPVADHIMASRLLMARVPEGARLVDNSTGGPPGFAIENVFVMAGIPRVMQAMLSTLENELEHGPIIQSKTVTAYLSESQIAGALGSIQDKFQDVDIGSYPFVRDGRFGAALVLRSADANQLNIASDEVADAVRACGVEPELS